MGIGKISLEEARGVADSITALVSSSAARIEVAGSIRRRKPVVGDIELVVIPSDQEKLVKFLREVGQTIKPGVPGAVPWDPKPDARYIRVRLDAGMNLDVFVARPENWGGLFMMRTGSASGPDGNVFNGFVPGVFGRFKKLSGGGRMTDCMPTMPTGEQLEVREESDFFDILEMDFVPPEERSDRKAIKRYARDLRK
jgi:DNA polymerase/3'-5' exonuclease PolX